MIVVSRAWTTRRLTAAGHRGFSLVELMVVIAIIVILSAIAIPSLSGLTRVSSEGAARTALRSLLASARSMAASKQGYVGVRFQQHKDGRSYAVLLTPAPPAESFPNGCPNYDVACTYLTLIVADQTEPLALPRGVEFAAGDLGTQSNPDLLSLWQPNDVSRKDAKSYVPATTFTVLFSPAGQIVRKPVHVAQRRDGWKDFNGGWARIWIDPVFNFRGDGAASMPPDVVDSNPVNGPLGSKMDTDPAPQNTEPGPNNTNSAKDTAIWYMSQTSIYVYEHEKRVEQTGLDAATCRPFTKYIQTSGSLIQLNTYTGAPVSVPQ